MRFGAYECGEELGRGGTGVVFRGRSPDGRDVAVKVLRGARPEDVLRFERERALHASLGGADGFVPLLDAGVSPDGWFIVMPYIGGGTLRERLRSGPLSVEETLAFARRLAAALGRAHRRGIVHRDLKPENVLFAAPGEPLIADLGLARQQGEDAGLSRSGEGRGTVSYVAPEQASNAKVAGPPADVFALAVIIYEALTGLRPFQDQSTLSTLARAASGLFTPLRELRADVPPWLDAVVSRCLAVRPEERPPDGDALARELSPPPPAAPPPPTRLPLLAAFALGGSVGAIVVGALALAPLPGARPRTPPTAGSDLAPPTSSTRPPPTPAPPAPRSPPPPATEPAPPAGERLVAPDGAARIDSDVAASKRLRLVARAGLDRLQHTTEVDAIAVSRDRVYAADDHGVLRVWSLADGRPVATTVLDAGSRATSIAVDPSSAFVGWVGRDSTAWVYEGGAWRTASRRGLDGRGALCLASTPGGRAIAMGREAGVVDVAWLDRGSPLTVEVGAPVTAMAFSPEGAYLATGTAEGQLAVWSATTGACLRKHKGARGPVRHLTLSEGGRTLTAIAAGVGVVTWSADASEAVVFNLPEPPRALGLDHDRARAVVVTEVELVVTDLATGERISGRQLPEPCRAAAISPGGDLVVMAPQRGGRLAVLDAVTGAVRPGPGGATAPITHIVEVGAELVTGSEDGSVRRWDGRGRATVLACRPHRLTALAADRASGRVVAGWADAVMQSHPLEGGGALIDLKLTGAPTWVCALRDGRVLVLERGSYVEELPPKSPPARRPAGMPEGPAGVFLEELPDGRHVTLSASDAMGALLEVYSAGRRLSSAVVPNGRCAVVVPDRPAVVIGGLDGALRRRDLDRGAEADEWSLRCHSARVSALALSPDGALGVSAGLDATLSLWDARSGALLESLVLRSSVDAVTSLRWAADGAVWAGTASGLLLELEVRQ